MKKLTLQERILLCEIDEIDWNYNVKATKTNDIRTTIQGEQDKLAERIFIPRTQEYVKDNRKYKNENEQ